MKPSALREITNYLNNGGQNLWDAIDILARHIDEQYKKGGKGKKPFWPDKKQWFYPELCGPDKFEERLIQAKIDAYNEGRADAIKAYKDAQGEK